MSNDYIRRASGLLVIEVVNSNPNGDPDRESDPRQRPDDRGEISPVSFKRKLRDLVAGDLDENGVPQRGPVWSAISKSFAPYLPEEEFCILESRGRNRATIKDEILQGIFLKKYWDARVFGNTFLEKAALAGTSDEASAAAADGTDGVAEAAPQPKAKKSTRKAGTKDEAELRKLTGSIKTGVVHFGMGVSVAPVAIERLTNTNKAGVETGLDRGMAPLAYRIVRHGVYTMPFFVNPSAAIKTQCSERDIALLLKLIPYAYAHNRSAIRPLVEIRHAWFFEHKNALGSCSDLALIAAMTPHKKTDPNQPSEAWDNYDVPVKLPKELQEKLGGCRDLTEDTI